MKLYKIFATSLMLFSFVINANAQTTEPTLKETLEWIRDKMNTYGWGSDNCAGSYPAVAKVNSYNVITQECKETGYEFGEKVGEAYTKTTVLSLYNVTRFTIYDDKVTLYASDKSVKTIKVYDDNSSNQSTSTSISFILHFYEEDNLEERFKKALTRLVYLNTKDKKKETF